MKLQLRTEPRHGYPFVVLSHPRLHWPNMATKALLSVNVLRCLVFAPKKLPIHPYISVIRSIVLQLVIAKDATSGDLNPIDVSVRGSVIATSAKPTVRKSFQRECPFHRVGHYRSPRRALLTAAWVHTTMAITETNKRTQASKALRVRPLCRLI